MPVPFGFVGGTLVRTPSGSAPIERLAVGDAVIAFDAAGASSAPRTVTATWSDEVDQLVSVSAGGAVLQGVTPGTAVWDAFEGTFRGAGSMSTAGELLVWDAGHATAVAIDDIPERPAPTTRVWHLTLDGDEGAFFADGVLVRHREIR